MYCSSKNYSSAIIIRIRYILANTRYILSNNVKTDIIGLNRTLGGGEVFAFCQYRCNVSKKHFAIFLPIFLQNWHFFAKISNAKQHL